MSKKQSDWYVPAEVLGLLGTVLLVPAIAVLAGLALPIIFKLENAEPFQLFSWGLSSGVFGITVLLRARGPLYRQRRFWTFGPRELDRKHRILYWIAHVFTLTSVTLLVIVWFRLR